MNEMVREKREIEGFKTRENGVNDKFDRLMDIQAKKDEYNSSEKFKLPPEIEEKRAAEWEQEKQEAEAFKERVIGGKSLEELQDRLFEIKQPGSIYGSDEERKILRERIDELQNEERKTREAAFDAMGPSGPGSYSGGAESSGGHQTNSRNASRNTESVNMNTVENTTSAERVSSTQTTSEASAKDNKKSKIKKAVALTALAMVAPIPAVLAVTGGVMVVKGAKKIKKNGGLTATGKKLASKLSMGKLKDDIKSNTTETAVVPSSGETAVSGTVAEDDKIDVKKLLDESEKEARQNRTKEVKNKLKEAKEKVKETAKKAKEKFDSMPDGVKIAASTVAFGIPGAVVSGVSVAKKKKKAKQEAENTRVEAETTSQSRVRQQRTDETARNNARMDRHIENEVERRVDEELDKRVQEAVDKKVEQAVRDEVQKQRAEAQNSATKNVNNEEYDKKLQNIEDRLNKITSSITELQDSVTDPKETKQIKDMAAKLNKITSEITELQDSVTNPKESAKIKEIDAKINKINSNITELQDSVTNPKETKQIKDMTAKLSKLSSDIDELQEFTTRGSNKGSKNN